MNNNRKREGIKNFLIYILFNFIFGFIVPLGIIILDVAFFGAKPTEQTLIFLIIALSIQSILILGMNEFLVCLITKKAANSTYLLSKFAFTFSTIIALIFTYLLFASIDEFKADFVTSWCFVIYAGIIILKLISYLLAKKVILKEKMEKKKLLFGGVGIFLFVIFTIFNLLIPSGVNKFLFNVFGSTDFSSKELKIYLTDIYNKDSYDTVNYFHKYSDEELEFFEILSINAKKITTSDINKLKYLSYLEINNISLDEQIDFSQNKELSALKLNNSKINSLNSKVLGNIHSISITKTNINTFDTNNSNLNMISIENSNIENFKIQGSVIEEIDATNLTIKELEISNTSRLKNVEINESNIENVVLDNNSAFENNEFTSYVNIEIDKMNNLELKNINDLNALLDNSSFIFKKVKFLDNKGFYLKNNDYLVLDGNFLEVPESTKVKELILENMTAVVTDTYHELISCEPSGRCTYDAEQKTKTQGPNSMLGDEVVLYDKNNKKKLLELIVSNYTKGEI